MHQKYLLVHSGVARPFDGQVTHRLIIDSSSPQKELIVHRLLGDIAAIRLRSSQAFYYISMHRSQWVFFARACMTNHDVFRVFWKGGIEFNLSGDWVSLFRPPPSVRLGFRYELRESSAMTTAEDFANIENHADGIRDLS